MGMLRVMSRRGDDRIMWDPVRVSERDTEAIAAIREAERIFEEQRARGATAFTVKKGQVPTRADRFDPEAESIVLLPLLVGG
jgi:hypothetical protein